MMREAVEPRTGRRHRVLGRGGSRERSYLLQYVLVFLASAVFINGLIGDKGLIERLRTSRQRQALVDAIEQLRSRNAGLREQIRRVRTEPHAVEELIRRDLGWIRPGEKVFIIKDAPPAAATRPEAPSSR
jgi:cell division protein FtsB